MSGNGTAEWAGSILEGDFNGDGKLDLAFTSYNEGASGGNPSGMGTNNTVSVLLGNGDGTFKTRSDYGTGPGPTSIVATDVNGDGHVDLVVSNSLLKAAGLTQTVSVLLGRGDGTFCATHKDYPLGTPGPTINGENVFLGDFNGDGKPDLGELFVDTSTYNVLAGISLANGDGTFQAPKTTNIGPYGTTGFSVPAMGDFNGDGKLDFALMVNAFSPQLLVFLGNGDGTFQAPVTTSFSQYTDLAFTLGDFNGDGKLDVAYVIGGSDEVGVRSGKGDGTFGSEAVFATGTRPYSVTAGDLNNDGKLDLIASLTTLPNSPCLSILLGKGDGTFGTHADINQGSCSPVVVADVNGDGKLDLVLSGQVMLGNGDGTFQTGQGYDVGGGTWQIAVADMNGDGKLDVVTADANDATFSVRYGNGDGTFSHAVAYLDPGPGSLAVADLNGDGAQDIAIPSPVLVPGVSIYLNSPTAALSPAALNFGTQTLGVTSASQDVELYNPGSTPITIAGVGAGGDFGAVNSCTDTVAIGANCKVSVTFTPLADGVRDNSLNVTDNALGSPQAVVLRGTGTGIPVAGLSATALTFSPQGVGSTSGGQTVTLNNTGNAVLSTTSIAATGDFAQTNTCGASVAAGGNCTINVTFTPTVEGSLSGTLTITDNNNGVAGSTQAVTLSGTGAGAAAGLSTNSLTFAGQLVGSTSAAQTVTLTNSGNAAMTVTSIAASGDFAETNTCGASVAAGGNCSISVTFKPSVGGSRTGTLTITDNAPGSPHTVNLPGTGQDFSLGMASGGSSSASVSPGQTANYSLSLGGLGGLSQSISFACTGAPSEATCTVNPSSATPGASGSVAVTVTVATQAPSLSAPRARYTPPGCFRTLPRPTGMPMALLLLALLCLGMARRVRKPQRLALRWALSISSLVLLALLLGACGGGGGGGGGGNTNPGTPAGTYTLTITGTVAGSSALQHTTTLLLQVT